MSQYAYERLDGFPDTVILQMKMLPAACARPHVSYNKPTFCDKCVNTSKRTAASMCGLTAEERVYRLREEYELFMCHRQQAYVYSCLSQVEPERKRKAEDDLRERLARAGEAQAAAMKDIALVLKHFLHIHDKKDLSDTIDGVLALMPQKQPPIPAASASGGVAVPKVVVPISIDDHKQ